MSYQKKKTVLPIYLIGIVWLLWAIFGSLTRPFHYIAAALVSLAAYFLGKIIFPDKGYTVDDGKEEKKEAPKAEPAKQEAAKPKTTGNTILSPHAYLQDASFTVFIETTAAWWERIASALRSPKWCMYLGRKNCVPSRPILPHVEEFADLRDALENYPAAARADASMTYECEIPDSTAASLLRPDELVGANRKFGLRRVWRGSVRRKEVQDVPDQN